ncbi:putative serine protease K12H4.7 [Musca vetustissima]|uniref:putative serine protease K12H4.7 n=1 Tax=Musca vetustissima TaxID=27455 RepID=UPI002AB7322E|nr:putative serine protease K12H4.7 [Musca vetustissima]
MQLKHRWWMVGEERSDNRSHYAEEMVQELWLPQKLDHFVEDEKFGNQSSGHQQWLMRYYVNAEFYEPGGPMFIAVGGEWEIQPYLLNQGHFYDMARQHNAIMFYTEHRFYGKSWPKSSASLDALQYLNVLQALEDLRHFIKFQKSSQRGLSSAKVVLLGASYSGSMVAWFMNLYPQEADVAWASSAPLLAKMDFHEFMTLTMDTIKQKGGPECSEKIEEAFPDLHHILSSPASKEVLQNLQMCSDFDANNELDISAFFNALGNYFAGMAQSSGKLVTQFCKKFTNDDTKPLHALVEHIKDVFLPHSQGEDHSSKGHGQVWCLDLSFEGMKLLFSEYDDISNGNRCWFYQTCNEFGWFATTQPATTTTSTDVTRNVFGGQVSLKFFQNLCQHVFEPERKGTRTTTPPKPANMDSDATNGLTLQELYSRAQRTNHMFGGLTNVSQNVIFTHGRLDPWRAVGMQHGGRNVLLLDGYGHVEDLGSINLQDSVEMNVAKLKVAAFINKALRRS